MASKSDVYRLTPSEERIIALGRNNPNVLAGYFFRPVGGGKAFQFDYNFTEKGKWQVEFYKAAQKTIVIAAGVGCVAGETEIYLPKKGKSERIDKLTDAGLPIVVLAWNGKEYVETLATAPFKKGKEALYEFVLEDGKSIIVQRNHLFLSKYDGWIKAWDLWYETRYHSAHILTVDGYKRIVSIRYNRTDDYYDMHVPGYENYVANGIVSHNTGKSLAAGMAAACWGITTEGFRFLNVAQRVWQAKLMYDMILNAAVGTPYEKLIFRAPERPHPKIVLRFMYHGMLNESILEFMSVEKNARSIYSWRGDWINIDEAGLIDDLSEVMRDLSTRLTGSTLRGRPFIGRMSLLSNPWDNPYFWYVFDMARSDPDALSMVLDTRDNLSVTHDQIKQMLKFLPEDEHERFLAGARPEGKGAYFSKPSIYACESDVLSEKVEDGVQDNRPGYVSVDVHGPGIVEWGIPSEPGHEYMLIGDPGIDNAPNRNSPVLMLWDVTNFPETPAILTYFWWGFGNGKIMPFFNKITEIRTRYDPFYTAIDSTATQRNMAELANVMIFEQEGMAGVVGLDFSGARKYAYLIALKLFLETSRMKWASSISGIRSQLANYDPPRDNKLAQDIVATMSMSAFAIRVHFHVSAEELANRDNKVDAQEGLYVMRLPEQARNRRVARLRS